MTIYEVAWEYLDPIFDDPRFVSDTMTQVWYYIASSASWQDWPNSALWLAIWAGNCNVERDCPFEKARFVPAITFRRSSSGCMTVFFRKLFSVAPPLLRITGFLPVLENKQVRRSFFQFSLWYIIHTLLTELVRSRWVGIGLVLFFLWTETKSWSLKTQKENLANIQPSWPRAWSMICIYRKVPRTAKWRRRYILRFSALS